MYLSQLVSDLSKLGLKIQVGVFSVKIMRKIGNCTKFSCPVVIKLFLVFLGTPGRTVLCTFSVFFESCKCCVLWCYLTLTLVMLSKKVSDHFLLTKPKSERKFAMIFYMIDYSNDPICC